MKIMSVIIKANCENYHRFYLGFIKINFEEKILLCKI